VRPRSFELTIERESQRRAMQATAGFCASVLGRVRSPESLRTHYGSYSTLANGESGTARLVGIRQREVRAGEVEVSFFRSGAMLKRA